MPHPDVSKLLEVIAEMRADTEYLRKHKSTETIAIARLEDWADRLEPVARTLSPEAGAVACEHENTSPHWDCISCDDCGAVLVSGPEWGVASRKWFKDKAEAKFFKNHGRFPVFDERSAQVAHPPASQVSEAEWREEMAEAFETFWNASLSVTHDHHDSTANAVMAGMVEGFAAMASQLRKGTRPRQVSQDTLDRALEAYSDVYDGMPGSDRPAMMAALLAAQGVTKHE